MQHAESTVLRVTFTALQVVSEAVDFAAMAKAAKATTFHAPLSVWIPHDFREGSFRRIGD